MSDNEVYDRLREPFEEAAYSSDNSRGFELTSIKAAYVFERLNEVFGLCGQGWRYAHSPFEEIDNEVCTEIALQTFVDPNGSGAVEWDNMIGHWRTVEGTTWSAPIFSPGGKSIIKGRLTDARKSAITDGITKAASMIGVGSDVFKGLVRVGNRPQQQAQSQPSQPAQAARDRAKAPAKTDGKIARPMSAETVKKALAIKAGDGTALASAKQAGFVARLAQEVWGGDDGAEQNYHSCLRYLFDVDSATKLTKGQASACITYLRQEPESTDNWGLHPDSVAEMKAILTAAIKEAGQQEFPFEGEWEPPQ